MCVGMRLRPPHAAVMRREEDRWDTGDGNGPRSTGGGGGLGQVGVGHLRSTCWPSPWRFWGGGGAAMRASLMHFGLFFSSEES